MVFSTGLITAILIVLLGDRPALFHQTWPIEIHLPDAPSVAVNTPIRKSGVLVGRVTEVRLIPEGGVVVGAAIDEGVKINANEVCQVQSSLFGDTSLRLIVEPGQKPSGKWLKPGAKIQGQVAVDPIQVVSDLQGSLSTAIGSISQTSQQLSNLVQRVDSMLAKNEESIDTIIQQTTGVLSSVKSTTDFTDELLSDPEFRENLKREVNMMPGMMADAREAISTLRTTMKNMDSTMNLLDENLSNIRDVTEPLGENAPQMVENMNSAIQRLDAVLGEFEQFSQTINGNQGTLGKLIHDDELYQRLNQAACNVQQVSSRLRPIVNDVRILTDKMGSSPWRSDPRCDHARPRYQGARSTSKLVVFSCIFADLWHGFMSRGKTMISRNRCRDMKTVLC